MSAQILTVIESALNHQNTKTYLTLIPVWFAINAIVTKASLPWKFKDFKSELDFRNRVVSIIHGLFSLTATFIHMLTTVSECGTPISNFESMMLVNSSAYFTFDFIVMAYYKLLDRDMTIHHIGATVGMMTQAYWGFNGDFMLNSIFLGEISNFPMHMRCQFKTLNRRYTKAYEAFEFSYFSKVSYSNFYSALHLGKDYSRNTTLVLNSMLRKHEPAQ